MGNNRDYKTSATAVLKALSEHKRRTDEIIRETGCAQWFASEQAYKEIRQATIARRKKRGATDALYVAAVAKAEECS